MVLQQQTGEHDNDFDIIDNYNVDTSIDALSEYLDASVVKSCMNLIAHWAPLATAGDPLARMVLDFLSALDMSYLFLRSAFINRLCYRYLSRHGAWFFMRRAYGLETASWALKPVCPGGHCCQFLGRHQRLNPETGGHWGV